MTIADLATAPVDAVTVMKLLPGSPRLLAMGEPTHGEDMLLEVRNELFRELVEQHGYRTIAIESDCLMGLVVDDYVTKGLGDPDEVMACGFSHGFGGSVANRELVRWMRSHNDGLPASDRVRFAGFDGPLEITGAASPRQAMTALHAYVTAWLDAELLPAPDLLDRLLGDDDRWTDPAAMMDPTRSIGQSADAGALRVLADDLVSLLDAQTPQLIAASSRDDWERGCLFGRTATGLLRYHHWLADSSPNRMAMLLGVRDSMMAANLLALAERAPALVFAHNAHLQRDQSSMRLGDMQVQWWSAGAFVNARLGPEYAFLATALGTIRHHGVHAPPPDTVEGRLYALTDDRFLVDPGKLAAALGDDATRPGCPNGSGTPRWIRATWPTTTASFRQGLPAGAATLNADR